MDMYEVFAQNPLLAILRNVPKEITLDYAGAILRGGVKVFEVALNSPDIGADHPAAQNLRQQMSGRCGYRHLRRVCTDRTGRRCTVPADTGHPPPDVLAFCRDRDVMLLPGVLTPTDVAVSLQYGFQTMKLFPAGDMPRSYVKDLKGPYNDTHYLSLIHI